MAAIYIEYHATAGAVRNLPEGADIDAELERAKSENPGRKCSVIATQSFGANPIPVAGPERELMPGY